MKTLSRVRLSIFLCIMLICISGISAQDLSIDEIHFYNSQRIPWYPGFLATAGIHVPAGAEVTLGFDNWSFIENSDTTLQLFLDAGLDENEYHLMSDTVVNDLGSGVSGTPLESQNAADERYYSLSSFQSDSSLQSDTANNYASEFAQLRLGAGIGAVQQIPLPAFESSPLSASVALKTLFVNNLSDEAMLSDANDAMQKKQLIFLSDESDRNRYLLTRFSTALSWDQLVNPNPDFDHGLLSGYSASVYAEVAPGFLNPSIDPGHSSEGHQFSAIEGVNASYYQTGFEAILAQPLFDTSPDTEQNSFSAFIQTEFSVDWMDALGANGRIPLEARIIDKEYSRRFRSEAGIGLYAQLPEFSVIRMYFNNRIRYLYANEFAANIAFTEYEGDVIYNSSWQRADGIAIDQGATYLESEFYLEFFQAFVLGALFRFDFSNTYANALASPAPVFELEVLFP